MQLHQMPEATGRCCVDVGNVMKELWVQVAVDQSAEKLED
jgi:hypothetical protein